jgi:hypothetical protein
MGYSFEDKMNSGGGGKILTRNESTSSNQILTGLKSDFLNNEIWTLTCGAAFQRAGVYSSKDVNKKKKEAFKQDMRSFVESLIPEYEETRMSEDRHLENIQSLSDASTKHNGILAGGRMNFGISQKMLNLYLKYMWCLGEIETPPHFPVDRLIQGIMKCKPIVAWTQMTKPEDYMRVIEKARSLATPEFSSIAEFELKEFERRNQTK